MRKHILKILLIPIVGILFSGCYTTLWMPDDDYDSEDFQSSEEETNFYPVNDYGDYYYYYNRPWWYSSVQAVQETKDRTKDLNAVRNANSGRGEFKRGGRSLTELPTTSLPTVSAPTAAPSTSSNTSKDNSGNRVESTSSSNNSSGNKTNSNPVRNNDGNRNTSGR